MSSCRPVTLSSRNAIAGSSRPAFAPLPSRPRAVRKGCVRVQAEQLQSLIEKAQDSKPPMPADPTALSSWYQEVAFEKANRARHAPFGQPEWKKHRSSSRYLRHINTMFASSVIRNTSKPVAFFAALAAAFALYNTEVPDPYMINVGLTPFTTTASALSLLLVFRTNASYGRWWEARKIWGGLLNRTRDFVRMGLTWFPDDPALKAQLLRYTVAFAVGTKVHVRGDEDMRTELEKILLPNELEAALSCAHVPNHLLRMLGAVVQAANLSPILTQSMNMNITEFEDILGKSERILKTPIPLSYTRMTSRFLMLWLALLPVALYQNLGWSCVPTEAFIAFCFMGIEEIGVQIEEPFSILALEAICGSVQDNCVAMVQAEERDLALIQRSDRQY